jgi:hypothetical protein
MRHQRGGAPTAAREGVNTGNLWSCTLADTGVEAGRLAMRRGSAKTAKTNGQISGRSAQSTVATDATGTSSQANMKRAVPAENTSQAVGNDDRTRAPPSLGRRHDHRATIEPERSVDIETGHPRPYVRHGIAKPRRASDNLQIQHRILTLSRL